MKKPLLPILGLLFLVSHARSQEMVIKPSMGGNLSWLSRDSYGKKYSPRAGFQTGVSAEFGKRFYVEPGIFYLTRRMGYTYYVIVPLYMTNNVPTPSGTMVAPKPAESSFFLSGFQVPVSIGYRIVGTSNTRSKFGLRIFSGASAFFPRANNEISELTKPQWAVFGGAGFDLGYFFLESKYEWTISHLQTEHTYLDRGKPRSLLLNLGVRIPVKKK